jgi:hypothetical protein
MRRVVTGAELSQHAMRPPDLVDAYVTLVERDIAAFGLLGDGAQRRSCPACGGAGQEAFRRLGFAYRTCDGCSSLFVSPAPDAARLARYQRESAAERFWRDELFTATADVRSRYALGPRAHWVAGTAAARRGRDVDVYVLGKRAQVIADVLAQSPVVRRCLPASSPVATAAGAAAGADAVVGFEVFERTLDLGAALADAHALVHDGGLLFVSTISGTGFEVRLLRAAMPSLVPPVHLQLLSRTGWTHARARAHFRLAEYSTPGELDVQAVAEACRRNRSGCLPLVLDDLVRHEDPEVGRALQELLQQAGLSSHVQFVALAEGSGPPR